eukprot:3343942-Pleurochrysis_carterae.AAC.1
MGYDPWCVCGGGGLAGYDGRNSTVYMRERVRGRECKRTCGPALFCALMLTSARFGRKVLEGLMRVL